MEGDNLPDLGREEMEKLENKEEIKTRTAEYSRMSSSKSDRRDEKISFCEDNV